MEKLFEMNVTTWSDDDDCPVSQIVEWDDGTRSGSYHVTNLLDCSEDSYIDLFSADDFIAAVKLGMLLAHDGYTGIHAVYEEKDLKEDEDEE